MQYRRFWKRLDAAELPALKLVERVRLGGKVETATAALTRAGEHGMAWYALAAAGAALDRRRRQEWIAAGVLVAGSYAASTSIKLIARRQRPPIAARGTLSGLSFPSSHTVTSFAAARSFSAVEPRAKLPAYALASAFAASRVHFCLHYPSDIAAGALIGDAIGRATVPLVSKVGS